MHEVALVEGWVELELLGHRRHQGELRLRRLAPEQGAPIVLELRTPAIGDQAAATHFYTPQAVYGIHPTTEAAVLEALTPECGEWIHLDEGSITCGLVKGHEGGHEPGAF